MKHLKFNSQQTFLVCLNLRQYLKDIEDIFTSGTIEMVRVLPSKKEKQCRKLSLNGKLFRTD